MARLIGCPSCRKQISDTSKICLYCGHDFDEQKRQSIKFKKDVFSYLMIAVNIVVWFIKKNIELIEFGFSKRVILSIAISLLYVITTVYFYYNASEIENGKNGCVALSITFFILGQLVVIGISEIIKKYKNSKN